jgi:hypothetical protein
MASSSIQGGERTPARPSGSNVDALGPSDSSDSGSDVQHEHRMPGSADSRDEFGSVPAHVQSTSDAQGTGERASATGDAEATDGADIAPDALADAEGAELDAADADLAADDVDVDELGVDTSEADDGLDDDLET